MYSTRANRQHLNYRVSKSCQGVNKLLSDPKLQNFNVCLEHSHPVPNISRDGIKIHVSNFPDVPSHKNCNLLEGTMGPTWGCSVKHLLHRQRGVPTKIDAIKSWSQPTNLNQVCSFLGLASFYRRYVKDFSSISSLLHALSKENAPFTWGPSHDKASNELKHHLTDAHLLVLPNFEKTFEIWCDDSGTGIGGMLM